MGMSAQTAHGLNFRSEWGDVALPESAVDRGGNRFCHFEQREKSLPYFRRLEQISLDVKITSPMALLHRSIGINCEMEDSDRFYRFGGRPMALHSPNYYSLRVELSQNFFLWLIVAKACSTS
jgi:hypothetical protein